MLYIIEALVLSFAAFSYVVFALASFGAVKVGTVAVGLAVAIAATVFMYRKTAAFEFVRLTRDEYSPALQIVAVCFLLYSHVVFLPSYLVDDLVYHLYVPQQMARTGGLYFSGLNLNTNFPMLFEFPLVVTELFGLSGNLGNLFFVTILFLLFCEFGRKLTRVPGWILRLSGLAVLTTPIVYDLVRSAYVEVFLTILVILAVLHYVLFQENGNQRHWLWCCVWLGLACATRYTALYCVAIVFAWEFFRKSSTKNYYVGMLITVMVCSPWYVKNLFLTGNPFFPMANAIFPSVYISDLRAFYYGTLLSSYNYGREWFDYIALPFRVLVGYVEPPGVMKLGFGGQLSLIFAIAFLGLNFKPPGRRFVSVMAIGFLGIWAVYSQQVRFLISFLLVPMVFGLEAMIVRYRIRPWMFVVLTVAVVGQNSIGILNTVKKDRIAGLLTGEISRDQFLAHHLPNAYDFAKEVNELTSSPSDRIYAVGIFGRSYYFKAYVESNTYYDAEVIDIAFDTKTPSPKILSNFLQSKAITHVLFDWTFYKNYQLNSETVSMPAIQAYFEQNFEEIARRGEVVLYRLKDNNS